MNRMRCTVGMVALLAIALGQGAGAAPDGDGGGSRPVAIQTAAYCADPDELLMLELVNAYRDERGLDALTLSQTLGAAARHHSESMAQFDYFDTSHDLQFEGPGNDETVSWQQNIAAHGYPDNTHTSRAENLAAGYEAAADTLAQWQNSPSHDEHLLSDRFSAIGIGRAFNPESEFGWYWTVTFGSLVDDEAKSCAGDAVAVETPKLEVELAITRSGRNRSSTDSAAAHDGDVTSAWHTVTTKAPRSGSIWFDLGEVRAVSRIEWQFAEAGAADLFEIQVSPDREAWETIAEVEGGDAGEWHALEWSGETRYVRFRFANPNDDPLLGSLAEVRIFA